MNPYFKYPLIGFLVFIVLLIVLVRSCGKDEQPQPQPTKSDKDRLEEVYGADKINERNQAIARARYLILTPEQFDNEEIIDILERNPAYKRDGEKVRQAVDAATAGVNRSNAASAPADSDAPDVIKFGDE